MNDPASTGREGNDPAGFLARLKSLILNRSRIDGRRLAIIYVVIFLVLSLFLFPPTRKSQDILFQEGDIADVDVIAPFTFKVPYSDQEIEINRANATISVSPLYRKNEEATQHLPDDLKVFMERIAEIADIDSLPESERISWIKEIAPSLKRDPVEIFLDKGMRSRILAEGLKLQKHFLDQGIINDSSPLRRRDYPHVKVISEEGEKLVPSAPLVDQSELESNILSQAERIFGRDENIKKLFYSVVRSHLIPNLIYDSEETMRRRVEQMEKVPRDFQVSKNQRIVAKHDKVTAKQIVILKALEAYRTQVELSTSQVKRILLFIGKGLRISLLLCMFGIALFIFDRKLTQEVERLTLSFIILVFYLLLMALVVKLPYLNDFLIPVAFVSLVTTAFFGSMSALIFTLFASLMIITHTELPASTLFVSILAGTAAIISIAQLRERKNFYTMFLYVSIAYIIGITSFGMTEGMTLKGFLFGGLWGITNSFVCTILVMFLLPIFESLFNVTTNFSLMELSDLNRPLLKRLIIVAPGTYHHSLMVGNMVEAVAQEINANGLLARVSAFYHDIGKLAKPEYFFENKGDNVNKHEKLAPTMSALILASHVKEGVELASREKLPRVVINAIREHHGTTVMAFFYSKALEYDSHDSVNINDFRYPGPRPRSKETALIMLADSSEAAVRSLKEPTAPRIKAIVNRIFESRMNDGELDHSGLTLNDIAVVREKFIQLLTGIFHPRISYPKQEEEAQDKEQVREDSNRQSSPGSRKNRI
ncbi:MAG: HDIG domain-containing protein [Candidatus Krumholzibacteriota bacterium]|nr:HDIG domain-containing protein [Candidatus Krumholzibacteriota bacterium]